MSNECLLVNDDILNKFISNSYCLLKNKNIDNDLLSDLIIIGAYFQIHNMEDLYFSALDKTKIFYENDSTKNIVKKYFKEEIDEYTYGYFILIPNGLNFKKKKYEYIYRSVIIGDMNKNKKIEKIIFLEFLIHELNHSISSINNSIKFDDDLFKYRIGLSNKIIDKNNLRYMNNVILNEFYNEYFTSKIINEILNLKYYNIKMKFVNKKLQSLPNSYQCKGYQEIMLINNSLLLNKELTNLVKDIFYNNGSISELENYFYVHNVDFKDYSNKLNYLSFILNEDKDVDIKELVTDILKCNKLLSPKEKTKKYR